MHSSSFTICATLSKYRCFGFLLTPNRALPYVHLSFFYLQFAFFLETTLSLMSLTHGTWKNFREWNEHELSHFPLGFDLCFIINANYIRKQDNQRSLQNSFRSITRTWNIIHVPTDKVRLCICRKLSLKFIRIFSLFLIKYIIIFSEIIQFKCGKNATSYKRRKYAGEVEILPSFISTLQNKIYVCYFDDNIEDKLFAHVRRFPLYLSLWRSNMRRTQVLI